jgi:hypothetical protein
MANSGLRSGPGLEWTLYLLAALEACWASCGERGLFWVGTLYRGMTQLLGL